MESSSSASKADRIRVLLVDDHKVVREGIRRLLELDEGIEVVGEAETGDDAITQVNLMSPQVVLMDIRIPGVDGIEAARRIKDGHPDIDIIILTSYAEEYVSEAIGVGVSGYLLKSVGYEELSRAIRSVRAGEAVIDRSLSRDLFRRFAGLAQENKEPSVSDRERSILRLLADGMTVKDMAGELFVSDRTIKRELRHLFSKLGVAKRAQAISEAHRRGLL